MEEKANIFSFIKNAKELFWLATTVGMIATFIATTAKECAFAIITLGMTDVDVRNLNRVIHYFQKTLNRNV
jgi:hypothetical protein